MYSFWSLWNEIRNQQQKKNQKIHKHVEIKQNALEQFVSQISPGRNQIGIFS